MIRSLRKNLILGHAVLLFMAITLSDATAEEVEMTPIMLEPLPVAEAATAHRVALVGDPPRMIFGAMAKEEVALELFEVQGHTALPLATIGLLLPAKLDFDLAAGPGEGLSVAYEAHGGATSSVGILSLVTGEAPDLPPPKAIVSERRPRFVRGGGTAVVISEDGKRAVYLEGGATPRRMELCTCLDAIAVTTADGLAVVAKTLRLGAPIANVPAGELTFTWPWAEGARPRPLFDSQDVFDYDAMAASGTILIAAVMETGLTVAAISSDGTEQKIPVEGLPAYLESFSPTLSVSGEVLRLATLAMSPSHIDGPSTLFYGTLQR